jgi:hypothetical protein
MKKAQPAASTMELAVDAEVEVVHAQVQVQVWVESRPVQQSRAIAHVAQLRARALASQ